MDVHMDGEGREGIMNEGHVRDAAKMMDSREKLEEDIWSGCEHLTMVGMGEMLVNVPYGKLLEWLDRQAAIAERETLHSHPMCAGSDTCPALNRLVGKHVEREAPETSDDSREKLLYDASELVADCAPSGGDCDPMYRAIVELLDRQAAITANETSHDNPYVGLVRGKQWERTEISDYYCGRCGWKVTDHDSYCPECGGAFHKASNKPDGKFDARKTAETPETDTSKCDMRDFGDSREKLEADVRKRYTHTVSTAMWPPSANKHTDMVSVSMDDVLGWLDRQAALTERECMERATSERVGWDCAECAEGLGKELDARCDPLKERIAELQAKVDGLTAERDMWRERCGRMLDAAHELARIAEVDE